MLKKITPAAHAGSTGSQSRAPDHHVGPARLVDDGRAERVVPVAEDGQPLGHRPVAQVRPARDHHAGRLAAGVRIDHLDALELRCRHPTKPSAVAFISEIFGRVAMPRRMIARIRSRSSPTRGSRGARTVSEPSPHSCTASLMYWTSLTWVSRCRSGVYQR